MQNKSIDFSSGDAGTMHYHQWMPEQPVAWLHIMHGMAEHSARYAGLATFLNQHGIMVTAGDHRGHGMTGSSADSLYHFADHNGWNQMVDDQWQLISHIARQQQLPLIILGHSMGSNWCLTHQLCTTGRSGAWTLVRLFANLAGRREATRAVEGL